MRPGSARACWSSGWLLGGWLTILFALAAPAESIRLEQPTEFEIVRDGRIVGKISLPAGSEVEVVRQADGKMLVRRGDFHAVISLPGSPEPAPVAAEGSFFERYCVECHRGDDVKGDFDLGPLLADPPADHLAEWHEVLDQIELESMPPEKALQPAPEEVQAVVTDIRAKISEALGETGRLTRRLNRAQYNNTMRDLLLVDVSPANAFPQDLGREGFDHVSEAQSVSPFLLEKYYTAAGEVLSLALVTGDRPETERTEHYPLSRDHRSGKIPIEAGEVDMTGFVGVNNGKPLSDYLEQTGTHLRPLNMNYPAGDPKKTRPGKGRHGYETVLDHDGRAGTYAGISFRNPLPIATYRVRVRAYAEEQQDRDGNRVPRSGPCILGIDVDGERIREFDVPLTDEPQTFEFEFTSRRSSSKVEFKAATERARNELKGIPNLVLCDVEFEGPLLPEWPPASTQAILGPEGDWSTEGVLENFISRAFRRPARPDEIAKYRAIAENEEAAGEERVDALRVALQAVLVSPDFLYLIEETRPNGELSDYELANRLSYFLWESMPDAELFQLAAGNQLSDPQVLAAQVRRMIADPKSDSFIQNFAGQWLGLRRVSDLAPDPKIFPGWDEALRAAITQETERFFETILRENLSVLTFLDSDFTWVNERLATHYGIEGVQGVEMQRVALPADSPRGGLLTQASILTVGSQPTRSSPVFRGVFVVEKLFNRPPPNPPAQVPDLPEQEISEAPTTLREKLAAHVANPACASCHQKIDPWGIALESFDGIGGWRELDAEALRTELPGGEEIVGVEGLKAQLLEQREDFLRGLTEKLLLYGLGRTLDLHDKEAIDPILREAARHDFCFQDLLTAIVLSKPFRTP